MARRRDSGRGSGVKYELSVRNSAGTIANMYSADRYIKNQVRKAVKESADATHALTFFLSPYDTGFMRDHIKTYISPAGLVYEVGWDAGDFFAEGLAFYVYWQEYGSLKMAAQPSLTPAYAHERPIFERKVREAVQRAVARGRV